MAAGLLLAAATGCGSGKASGGKASGGTLIVFGAGTLARPFAAELQAFKKQNPGLTVRSQFGGSGTMTKNITELGQPADVLGVADYSLIPKLMFTGAKPYATWYTGFASNQITFAYTDHSKGAGQLTAANWYKVLAQPGVRIGRSNPATDPSGYQTLQMLQLAQGYYHDPTLSASVLRNSPDSTVVGTETSLLAALQSGQIDYLAIYRSDALQHHLRYVALPSQLNLSDPALAATYGKVAVKAGSLGTLTAKPIIYALTVPRTAPNVALGQKFIAFVLGPQGQAIMKSNGFIVRSPALASDQGKLPASLRPFTQQWPGTGG
ncbi:MAG TPA: extracellular solute-binding protein [Streptosporangiaceae bacterium]